MNSKLFIFILSLGFIGCNTNLKTRKIEIEIGTGEWMFVPINNEEEVQLAMGSQGGYHIWTSVRTFEAIQERNVDFSVEVVDDDGVIFSKSSNIKLNFMKRDDGSVGYHGWTAQLIPAECAKDKLMNIKVKIQSSDGGTGEASKKVLVRFDNPPKLCEKVSP